MSIHSSTVLKHNKSLARPIKGQHFPVRWKGRFHCSTHDPLLPTLHSLYFSLPEFETHNTAKFDSLFWSSYCHKYSPAPFGSTVMGCNPVLSILQNETTIKDTQLGSHCSGTCLSPFQCCFVMVFRWNFPSSSPTLKGGGKRTSSTACRRYSFNWPKFQCHELWESCWLCLLLGI